MADSHDPITKMNESLDKVIEKSEDDFEKQLIFIASGALGISFAFIEKIVPLNTSVYFLVLALSWISLTLALCVNLFSHYLSIKNLRKSKSEYSIYCEDEEKLSFERLTSNNETRNKGMELVNYASTFLFSRGLYF